MCMYILIKHANKTYQLIYPLQYYHQWECDQINNININKHIQLNLVNYIVNVILCDISEVICTYYVAMYN